MKVVPVEVRCIFLVAAVQTNAWDLADDLRSCLRDGLRDLVLHSRPKAACKRCQPKARPSFTRASNASEACLFQRPRRL